jgi:alpha-beta hydrolase superfamily lysophospholipase
MTLTPKLAFLSKPWFYLTFPLGLVLIVGLLGAASFPTDVATAGKLADRQPWPLGEGDLHRSSRGGHGRLVVLLHGFGWYGHASMRRFKEVIQKLEPEADIWIPPLPLRPWDFADPEVAAEELVLRLNQLNQAHSYEQITLVGHSSGAVFARKLWVLAHGARFDGTVELGRFASWPARIDRIVLLAGMNRGWSVASAMGVSARINFAAGAMLGHLVSAVSYGRLEPSVFGLRRGAPFLTRMRLQWLAVERALDGGAALGAGAQPLTIQLVGTRDDLVAPTDHIDRASGADFHYVEVVESTHANILDVDRELLDRSHSNSCGDPDGDIGAAHAARVCLALIGTPEAIAPVEVDRSAMLRLARETLIDSRLPLLDGAGITDTVFVVHGIRDPGYWARRMAILLTERAKGIADGRKFEAFADSYGYFPMVPFIMPWTRRAKVEWLLDLLVSRISDQPGSRLHYVGHSNGTYLLGMALKVLPMQQLRFERVVMAGSVLPSGYAWPVTREGAGIGCVVNYVATADWVVAVFPNGISVRERVGELGAAGHQGFGGEPDRGGVRSAGPGVWNVRWVEGSHAAALQQERWDEIVRFVTTATVPCADPDTGPGMLAADADRPSALLRIMGFFSPALVVLLFLFVTVVGWAILDALTWRDRARAALFVGWIAVVLLVAFQL